MDRFWNQLSKYNMYLSSLHCKSFVKEWWWVFLVLMGSFVFHVHASSQKQTMLTQLNVSRHKIESKKSELARYNEELQLRIDSQDDPEWVRLMLMKSLGVIPEGTRKVHFDHQWGD